MQLEPLLARTTRLLHYSTCQEPRSQRWSRIVKEQTPNARLYVQ